MPGPTTCTFANTFISRGFDFTFAPGVQPSVCRLRTVPHTQSLPQVGDLVFQTAGESPFVFRDCLVEQPQLDAGRGGQFWTLPVLDRRWRWQPPWGPVYGHYNEPKPDGSYRNEATPQELAEILLSVLLESNCDVSQLPNDTRPEKMWDGAAAASELDNLCNQLGCIVVLNPFSDRVELWRVGEGLALPTGATDGATYAPVLPAQPSLIKTEAGETLFQATFATEAVGKEIDGTWKRINELSYTPAGGWSPWMVLCQFANFPDTQTYVSGGMTLKIRDLAAAYIYRAYRLTGIMGQQGANRWCPTMLQNTAFAPTSLKDLRLSDNLVDEVVSAEDGGLRPLPASVFARWSPPGKVTPNTVVRYSEGFSLDSEHGIVQTSEPLWIWPNSLAEVRFECAFLAGAYGVFHRRSIATTTGAPIATPRRLVQVNEIHARVIYRYNNSGNLVQTDQNLAQTDSNLSYWQNAALDEYGLQQGGTVNYVGLQRISPDGLTQQITWSGGGNRPAMTVVSQAQRHNRNITPPDEYRQRLIAARTAQQLQQIAFRTILRVGIGGGIA